MARVSPSAPRLALPSRSPPARARPRLPPRAPRAAASASASAPALGAFAGPLRDARGRDAEIPHLHSDHLPVYLYETTVPLENRAEGVKLVLPESEDTVVNMYAALGRPDEDPHWADLWQGSVALAEEVLANPETVRGKRVVDLGTGLGLAGIAAALAGAKEVVLTDREPRALYCALCAAEANGIPRVADVSEEIRTRHVYAGEEGGPPLPDILRRNTREERTTTTEVRSNASENEPNASEAPSISAALLDWFAPDYAALGGGGFDVILACDVLYTPEAVDHVARLALGLMGGGDKGEAGEGGGEGREEGGVASATFLLADPPGRFPRNHARFVARMKDPGSLRQEEEEEEEGGDGGEGGEGGAGIRARREVTRVEVREERTRTCVNLAGEAMEVELKTYVVA